jgi:hypothetical protein
VKVGGAHSAWGRRPCNDGLPRNESRGERNTHAHATHTHTHTQCGSNAHAVHDHCESVSSKCATFTKCLRSAHEVPMNLPTKCYELAYEVLTKCSRSVSRHDTMNAYTRNASSVHTQCVTHAHVSRRCTRNANTHTIM